VPADKDIGVSRFYQLRLARLALVPSLGSLRPQFPIRNVLLENVAMTAMTMAWEDGHLHDFRIGRKRYGKPDAGSASWTVQRQLRHVL
jgi:hypothetical protein